MANEWDDGHDRPKVTPVEQTERGETMACEPRSDTVVIGGKEYGPPYSGLLEGQVVTVIRAADDVNAELKAADDARLNQKARDEGWDQKKRDDEAALWHDPYKPGTQVIEFEVQYPIVLARVHGDSDRSRTGPYFVAPEDLPVDLRPLSAERAFALVGKEWSAPGGPDSASVSRNGQPELTTVSEVVCFHGARIRFGELNPVPDHNQPGRPDARTGGQALEDSSVRYQFQAIDDRQIGTPERGASPDARIFVGSFDDERSALPPERVQ